MQFISLFTVLALVLLASHVDGGKPRGKGVKPRGKVIKPRVKGVKQVKKKRKFNGLSKGAAKERRTFEIDRGNRESPLETLTRHYRNRIENTFKVWVLAKVTHPQGEQFSDIFQDAASHQAYGGSYSKKCDFARSMTSVNQANVDAAHTFGSGLKQARSISDKVADGLLQKAVGRVNNIPHNINSCGGLDMLFDAAQYKFMEDNYDATKLTSSCNIEFYRIQPSSVHRTLAVYEKFKERLERLVQEATNKYTTHGNQPNILATNALDDAIKSYASVAQIRTNSCETRK